MQKHGHIKKFDASRGFGFIQSRESPSDVFFHLKDFRSEDGSPPAPGLAVVFDDVHIGGKGPRALRVFTGPSHSRQPYQRGNDFTAGQAAPVFDRQLASAKPQTRPAPRSARSRKPDRAGAAQQIFMTALVLAWLGLTGYGVAAGQMPRWWLLWLLLINIGTVFAYAFDKSAAERGRWRTSEQTLHSFALLGGWPAAWAAQQIMRHKCSKASFQLIHHATVFLSLMALGLWIFWLPGYRAAT